MSSESYPPLPDGSDREAQFMQRVHGRVFGPLARLRSSRTVKVSTTHGGIFLKVKQTPPARAQAPSTKKQYTFIRAFGDYTLCSDSSGKTVPIAKPPDCRNSITSLKIYGQTFAVTYPHNTGNLSDPLAYVYKHMVLNPNPTNAPASVHGYTPPYLAASTNGSPPSIIYASTCADALNIPLDPADNITPPGTVITLVEEGARAWTQFANQAM